MKTSEFFPDFKYEIPRPLTRIQTLRRRLGQLRQLLFSVEFTHPGNLSQVIQAHYSHQDELKFYEPYLTFGFHENEREAFWESGQTKGKALVVGCGTGRETRALHNIASYKKIVAIDFSQPMIESAHRLNTSQKVNFIHGTLEDSLGTYDLIWISALLESHIQGRQHRIQFFKNIYQRCLPHSSVVITPLIKKLHWKQPQYWSSLLLKLRWNKNSLWEKGDVLQASLENHRLSDGLIYVHYYPSKDSFISEIQEAGFQSFRELPGGSWIINQ